MRNWIFLGAVIGPWSLLGGCGSSEKDSGTGGDGDGDSVGDGDIQIGDGDVGDGDSFSLEPGPLTDEELEALRDSACAGWSFEPELQPSVLQMVIDVSGSMDLPPENGGTETKWVTTREALRDTVETLPGTISLGAVYYPNMDTQTNCTGGNDPCDPGDPVDPGECVNLSTLVDVATLGPPGSTQRTTFADSLDSATPAGGTPTHDAYNIGFNELQASDAIGQRFLLLITDGQPTFLEGCSGSGFRVQPVDEQPIIDAIAAAREEGVRTFVIGSPGSEENASTGDDARPWLSRAAMEGGTAEEGCTEDGPNFCHFDMSQETDFSGALRQALAAIIGQITSCDLNVPAAPEGQSIDPDKVNVVLTPFDEPAEVIARTEESECVDGWTYGGSAETITLCEDTCLRLKENARSGIELFFGCEGAVVGVK